MRAWLGQVPLRMRPSLGAWVKPLGTPNCCVVTNPDGSQQLHCTNPDWVSPPGSYPGYPSCGGGTPVAAPAPTPSTAANPGPGGGGATPVSTGPGGGGQQTTTPPAAPQPSPAPAQSVQDQAIQNQAGLPAPMSQTYPAQPTGMPGGSPFSGPGGMGPMPVQNIAPPPPAAPAPAGPAAPAAPVAPPPPPPTPCPTWSLPVVEWSKCVIRGHM